MLGNIGNLFVKCMRQVIRDISTICWGIGLLSNVSVECAMGDPFSGKGYLIDLHSTKSVLNL